MDKPLRVIHSPYMTWAKSHVHSKYHLASSGLANYSLKDLPFSADDLEITGDSFYGYAPLLEALAAKCGVPSEMIFTTLGTSMANHLAMAALIEPGDHVLVEHPTYELLLSTARYLGATVDRFPRRPENGFAIDPDEVRKTMHDRTRLIVLTNLHNPTSVLTDETTLKTIGAIAGSTGAHVLVDEVYLDAAYALSPRSSIHLGDRFVVTSSLTKVYGLSGLRCGWVLASPRIIETIWHLNDLFTVIPSHPAELLSVIALRNLDRIFDRAKVILSANHELVNRFLDTETLLECVRPGFGTVVFPRMRKGSVEVLAGILEGRFATTIGLGTFFEMPDYLRLGLGIGTEEFREGLANLKLALRLLEAEELRPAPR